MARNPYVVEYAELPAWAQDNAYIQTGYRRPGDAPRKGGDDASRLYHDSFYQCWRSVWNYWHNETMNIHTHLFGAVVALGLLTLVFLDIAGVLPSGPWDAFLVCRGAGTGVARLISAILGAGAGRALSPPDWADVVGLAVFLVAAVTCLVCSATYHTFSCHSLAVSKSFNRLDYVGIVVMIVGSNIPALHYSFYCRRDLQAAYVAVVVALGTVALNLVVRPVYATPRYRPVRAGVFVALGLTGAVPVFHGMYLYGHTFVLHTLNGKYIALSGALYIAGAALYVMHVPERFSPRTFDLVGSSHQIFHVCVLAAAACHYHAVRSAYQFWHALDAATGSVGTGAVCHAVQKGWV
ncbi:hypothetical protein MSPP1_000339 [Malassezia sp. CBS 17886]|nr:hypothetical protein MSPP1_000339 [Malassezia sp. CBS 17886]